MALTVVYITKKRHAGDRGEILALLERLGSEQWAEEQLRDLRHHILKVLLRGWENNTCTYQVLTPTVSIT